MNRFDPDCVFKDESALSLEDDEKPVSPNEKKIKYTYLDLIRTKQMAITTLAVMTLW